MRYSYWVSYQYQAARGSGFGDLEVTTVGPMTVESIPDVKALIQRSSPLLADAGIVIIAISKFGS